MKTFHVPNLLIVYCTCGTEMHFRVGRPDLSLDAKCPSCDEGLSIVTAKSLDFIDIFNLFGIQLSVDYDGQLISESESEIPNNVKEYLFRHQYIIQTFIESRGVGKF